MNNLFTYGTLMNQEIMHFVSGAELKGTVGEIHGFRRCRVKNEDYPGVIKDVGHTVQGIVYSNVSKKAWERLDAFEGEMYKRILVDVLLNSGETVQGQIYLVKPAYIEQLEENDWSYEEFLRSGKERFIRQYAGYDNIR